MAPLNEQDTYVSSVFVEAGFDAVWDRITDPLNFPEMYPAWTSAVEKIDRGTGPDGDEFVIRPELNRKFGVVDFTVEAGRGVERSRSRLFEVADDACELVHLAVRWNGIDDERWEDHKRGTDDDLERMKRLVESK